ncbi:phosphoenolpyruvate--protein phosphotransferase [Bradyrhizobium guangzhouense]|uniref:phosphoenolpyruvate--protein phosphotransferase n=1 Tax=Bradyrhizobium guangzhouense TaxID=1325095 RepID=UPI001009BD60|nr:phosphoenolpyruvate--protein phosphotransferase [Bradyrhizobium guangzhouense]RXH20310.1 phosphoenolpyruvate--protein phosphotransferase [Bradyrhizobium guangzhouense]
MGEIHLTGHPASPGLAIGPVAVLTTEIASRAAKGDPAQEAAELKAAIEGAAAELADLIATVHGEAAEILEFQVAMLGDDALAEGAYEAIAEGTAADEAWRAALEAEISGYRAADEEYFRARAADLVDIRDRVLAGLNGANAIAEISGDSVVTGDDISPSTFLAVDWTRGGAIALAAGSPSSHVAMLARSRGAPMVVGLGPLPWNGQPPSLALVDGDAGTVIFDPHPETRRLFEHRMAAANAAQIAADAGRLKPALTADGMRIAVMLNVAAPEELASLDPIICDGIGLVRTEFLFEGSRGLPREDTQYQVYRRILEWAKGRPVTIRTLDAGGDKPIPGVTVDGERNPFLGLRGIRLSLARPEVFRVQLRALCRAAVHGTLKVMLPMVAIPSELDRANALLDAEFAALRAERVACARPPLGIMVEVPSAALCAEDFGAAFYSIGSNDLTQYTMAAARDIGAVAGLNDAGHPAVLALIARTVEAGRKRGVEVSLCGDAAADTRLTKALLATGLTTLSVSPIAVARLKAAIAGVTA